MTATPQSETSRSSFVDALAVYTKRRVLAVLLLGFSGGLPIVVDDQLIGAVGVGGGNADEQCAYQALVKVLGPQPPLATPPAGGGGGQGQRPGQ